MYLYAFFIRKRNKPTKDDLDFIITEVNKGYRYEDIAKKILDFIANGTPFEPMPKYTGPLEDLNVLKHSFRYFHKELNKMSGGLVSSYDPNTGVITSSKEKFWIEPKASYTIGNVFNYFDKNVIYDRDQFPKDSMIKMFQKYIDTVGIDIVMFMIEHQKRMSEAEQMKFNFFSFKDMIPQAKQYRENAYANVSYSSGGTDYVLRERLLPSRSREDVQ